MDVLATLPNDRRFGVGVINQRSATVDSVEVVVARGRHGTDLFGAVRVLLNPHCGFATFDDNCIVATGVVEVSLAVLARARDVLRG